MTANKRKMDELEENLLFKLTSIQGPLVDDESLIEVLNVTKITSEEVIIGFTCNLSDLLQIVEKRFSYPY